MYDNERSRPFYDCPSRAFRIVLNAPRKSSFSSNFITRFMAAIVAFLLLIPVSCVNEDLVGIYILVAASCINFIGVSI